MFSLYVLGYYCLYGQDPTGCPPGTYNSITGLAMESECTDCSAGHYCEGIANVIPTGQSIYHTT